MWKRSNQSFIRNYRPLIMAHRGDSANIPENTLQSFEDAYQLNVDCIESDLHMTKDGEFVFFHDEKIDRTTNAEGAISEFTLEELKQLDAAYRFQPEGQEIYPYRGQGFKIQTLDEIIPIFPKVRFNLDIKSKNPDAPQILAEKLEKLNAQDRVMVGSFHQKQIYKFRKHTNIPTSAGPREVFRFWRKSRKWIRNNKKDIKQIEIPNNPETLKNNQQKIFGKPLSYVCLQIPEGYYFLRLISPEFIRFAHYVGIAIHVWTINDQNDMKRLLSWNIDGIFTDKPSLLLKVWENYQNE